MFEKLWPFHYQRELEARQKALDDAIRVGDPALIRLRKEALEFLRRYYRREYCSRSTSSGSLAILMAMRRASSRVRGWRAIPIAAQ